MSPRPASFATALALSAFALLAAPLPPAQAVEWLDGGGRSCEAVCRAAGREALRSGIYRNGQPFFVCSADMAGEGWRPGYNLQPNWSRACWVGWGGREVAEPRYLCACE